MGEMAEIFERLSRIEQTAARIDERTERHDKEHNDHEARLRVLEAREAKRSGVLAAASVIGGLIVSGLAWLVKLLTGSN